MISRHSGLMTRNINSSASMIQRITIESKLRFGRRSRLSVADDEGMATVLSTLTSQHVHPARSQKSDAESVSPLFRDFRNTLDDFIDAGLYQFHVSQPEYASTRFDVHMHRASEFFLRDFGGFLAIKELNEQLRCVRPPGILHDCGRRRHQDGSLFRDNHADRIAACGLKICECTWSSGDESFTR